MLTHKIKFGTIVKIKIYDGNNIMKIKVVGSLYNEFAYDIQQIIQNNDMIAAIKTAIEADIQFKIEYKD